MVHLNLCAHKEKKTASAHALESAMRQSFLSQRVSKHEGLVELDLTQQREGVLVFLFRLSAKSANEVALDGYPCRDCVERLSAENGTLHY